jgi:hypothetical protein
MLQPRVPGIIVEKSRSHSLTFGEGILSAIALLTAAIGIQLVILTLKFRLEVFIANPRFEDFDVSVGVCGGSSLPGTG